MLRPVPGSRFRPRTASSVCQDRQNQERHLGNIGTRVELDEFAASRRCPHGRADMVSRLKMLQLAHATVKKRWSQIAAPTIVLILLGRPCKEVMKIITHHIEHGPESYRSLQDPHRSTVKQIIKRIHRIRGAGLKVSVQTSDHHD